jgi:hypothetical protein
MNNTGYLPLRLLNLPVTNALKDPASSQIVSDQLNAVLHATLISSAESRGGLPALVSLLETLRPADLATDQNLSLRDFVAKYATLPADPAANKAAQQAIATLSTSTTVGQFLGLNQTIAANPIFSGFVAQTNLVSLMTTSPTLFASLQTDFIQKYTSFRGSTQDFWNQLSQDPTLKAAIPELQFTMQLGALTLNNSALVSALRANYKPTSIRDLTKVDASTLTQLITTQKISIPVGISGSTPAEQIANYASGIVSLLQSAFPTDYVAQALSSSKDATLQSVAKVLGNAPDIDLQRTNLTAYLKQNSATAFQGIPPDRVSAVTALLEGTQRVSRFIQQPTVAAALLEAGMDSAAKITAMASSTFVGRFSAALGGDAVAQSVYSTASNINAQTTNFYSTVQSSLRDVSPRVIANPNLNTVEAIKQQIPNWQTLFGTTSYCTCGECDSVYGPAAYLVDLLQFLRNSGLNAAGNSAFDILIGNATATPVIPGRRPDLQYIKLDCQNADTPLPYVDLINEVLESYIALGGHLGQTTAHNTQSDANADELRVNPEYVIQSAYDTLAQAIYPQTLPYDRFLDIARTYLTFLGGDRRQVIEQFGTQVTPFDTLGTLVAETLGLSPTEFKLIANWDLTSGSATAPAPLNSLYVGNMPATSPWETWIANASVFLQQTGLTFDDLVNLLETEFINPGQTIALTGASGCDITQTVISPLDDSALTRIYPFLRLWKKLGWTMSDLDKSLRVFGGNGVNRGCLLALADFVWLLAQLNLTVTQLLTLWSVIDADGRNSLYLTLFQNKAVLNPVDARLRLSYLAPLAAMPANPLPASVSGQLTYNAQHQLVFVGKMTDEQRADLLTWASSNAAAVLAIENLYEMRWFNGTDITQGPGTTITEATPAILAALRISADDLNAIRTAAGLTDSATKTPLTLANLSQLYRYTVLAQAIGLSIPDLIALISLTGIDPFQLATSDPVTKPAIQFVRAARAVLASPFAVSNLNYIYRAVANPAVGEGPLESTVHWLAITLQTGLVKIAATNSYTPDPTGKVLRQKLGTITAGSDLDAAMGLISGTGAYKTPLDALPPGLTFPATLPQISYDATGQELEFSSAMTDAQKSTLMGLSGDSTYLTAVSILYQQPRDIISNSLSFLDPSLALSHLITSPLATAADRYAFVLQALLNYLTDTQSISLVQQTLGETLGLSSAMLALLLVGDPSLSSSALLHSQRNSTQPAIVDLLDLRQGGLLTTQYSDTNLTAVAATQVESEVRAAGISNPGGARWQGEIQPEFGEPYTFYVTANDGVRLWVDDELLIDQWSSQASSVRTSPPINLNAGQLYDIRLDYFNTSASAMITLGWSSQSTSNNVNTPIATSAMLPENALLTLDRLYPAALLLTKFAVKPDELAYLSAHGTAFQGVDPGNTANTVNFDLTTLPLDRSNPSAVDHLAPAFFNQWLRLNELFQLRNSLPLGNATLFDVFRAASGSTNPAALGTATTNAALAATGWDTLQFSILAGKTTDGSTTVGFGLSDADFVNEKGTQGRGLVWLQRCLSLSQRLGVPVLQLFLWANQTPDAQQSDDIKNTVKAKYNDAAWTTVGQPLNDKVRNHSRSALIAYVLNMPQIVQLGFTGPDDLYTYFLIDVQMSPCMQTSRIVQATAAVQLFVQRCLLNLENNNSNTTLNVSPGAIDAAQWEWRKNYRVWEANREVFLYPENWIDPTLRDNRTSLFEDLKADLQKGPVTADTAEAAFQSYLTKLLEISRLEICGFVYENDSDSNVTHNLFHVFGRTYATPHIYYYRTFDRMTGIWSAWETVDVDISGDHLIPVVWNRRLYLFWPLFKEQSSPNSATANGNVSVPTGGSTAPVQTPLKSLEVMLAWSEYRDGSWTKKQVTADSLVPSGWESYNWDLDPSVFSFDAQPNDPSLTINMFYWRPAWDIGVLRVVSIQLPFALFNCGSFFFDGCSSVPAISSLGGEATSYIPYNTSFDYMALDENRGGTNLQLINLTDPHTVVLSNGMVEIVYTPAPLTVLNTTPIAFSLAYPSEYLPDVQINRAPPFFYADNVRTYLVTQRSLGIWNTLNDSVAALVPYSPEELAPAVSSAMVASLPVFADEAPVATVATTLTSAQFKTATPVIATSVTVTPANTTPWQSLSFRPIIEFTFATHRHAHVCDFLKALNWQGIPGLLTLDNQTLDSQDVGTASMFYQQYQPANVVNTNYPSEHVDFSYGGAYSIYNWEIFFHIPLLIATQLSQNQQFDDAEAWFRYVFNPTSDSTDPVPGRYWNFLPFNQNTDPERIEDLVNVLAYTGSDPTTLAEKASFNNQIAAWEQTPFDPDLIARMRMVAYQKATVMRYIDHQLAWGDSLYQQFTRESVNEATLHYVLCQDILGDKPVELSPHGFIADQTYAGLVAAGLDAFSDALVTLENLFPFSSNSTSDSGSSGATTGIAVPYFCFPPNEQLLGYWDTVAQRLYRIRHCMNIAGQVQPMPLFAPPINPADLIHALEMGMDLTSALSDISAATPFYRFAYMLPKALELCAEVRSLGSSLLAALEKSDAEALSLLRATQETALMKAIRNVKQQQLNEANSNLDALNDTLAVTHARQQYYQSLVGAGLSPYETQQISLLTQAQTFQGLGQQALTFGSSVAAVPDETVGAVGPFPEASAEFGGRQLAAIADFVGGGFGMLAAMLSSSANIIGIEGGFYRRNQEWEFQLQTATLEIQQINDQIKAAQARVDAAQADLDNQDLQISNSSGVENFLRTKYTNQDLYDWMVGQVSSVYFQCYQMAYDLAKRAEACYVFERMPNLTNYTSFIQFGYWDSLKKGLLSGERMYQDLKRLEIAYMDQNQRDFEISKSISLLLLDPVALINLKETGYCTVQFPEALFDMDYPGHYLRRIKLFSVIIPCVVGPYTSLNCTLTLATNKIRIDTTATTAQDYVKDANFITNFAASESIATSSGQNDSGLFVVNFNDERYLPFEGAGAISTWQLSMPLDTNAFDFDTITDVIFNLKYTARDGGAILRTAARAAAVMPPGSTIGATPASQTPIPAQQTLSRMFSLRHEFPSSWNAFLHPPDAVPDQTMTINLAQERFPFQYRGKKIQMYEMDVFLKFRDIYDATNYTTNGTPLGDYAAGTPLTLNLTPPGGIAATLQLHSNTGLLSGVPAGSVPQPPPVVPPTPPVVGGLGGWTLVAKGTDIANIAASLRTQVTVGATTNNRLAAGAIEDVFLICRYSAA